MREMEQSREVTVRYSDVNKCSNETCTRDQVHVYFQTTTQINQRKDFKAG